MKRYKDLLADNLTTPMKMEIMVGRCRWEECEAVDEHRLCQLCAGVHAGWEEDSVRLEQAGL